MKMDEFSTNIKVPRPPLQSVSSVTYQDVDNATQTLASSNYTVDTNSEPGRLVQSNTGSYPSTYSDLNSVTITYVAGYGAATAVPETYKRAIKLYVEMMHDMPSSAYGVALKEALDISIMRHKVESIAL